ncbi:MAG: toxin-activating lysine-acyltransferase, partial [Methyloligellaceae bacterium]
MIFGKNKESENSTSEMHVPEAVAATGMDVVETETTEKTEQTISNEAKARLQAAKLLSARLGEIVSLFMRSSGHKHFSFSDLEWLVLPALVRNQIAIAEARDLEKGLSAPIGIVMWASVSEEVDKKYSEDLNQPMRLHPDEWNSGEIFWIVDAVGNQKAV